MDVRGILAALHVGEMSLPVGLLEQGPSGVASAPGKHPFLQDLDPKSHHSAFFGTAPLATSRCTG